MPKYTKLPLRRRAMFHFVPYASWPRAQLAFGCLLLQVWRFHVILWPSHIRSGGIACTMTKNWGEPDA